MLKEHIGEIEDFKDVSAPLFKIKDDKERLDKIQHSIISIEKNLKAHLNTFQSGHIITRASNDEVLLSE